MMFNFMTYLTLILLLSACKNPPATGDFVPVVGLDTEGKSQVNYVPTPVFQNKMSPFIGQLSADVGQTLDQYEDTADMPWILSRVTVGLGLEADFEAFNILETHGHADLEIRFQKVN